MDGHDPYAVAPLLDNRRLGGRARVGLVFEPLDEAAKRDASSRLVLARQLGDVQGVRQRLLARRAEGESGVGARLLEKTSNRLVHRHVVARPVQIAQQVKPPNDRDHALVS